MPITTKAPMTHALPSMRMADNIFLSVADVSCILENTKHIAGCQHPRVLQGMKSLHAIAVCTMALRFVCMYYKVSALNTDIAALTEDVDVYFKRLAACKPTMPSIHFTDVGYIHLVSMLESTLEEFDGREAASVLHSLAILGATHFPGGEIVTALLVHVLIEVPELSAGSFLQTLEALVTLKRAPEAQALLSCLLLSKTMRTAELFAAMLEATARLGTSAFDASLWQQVDTEMAAVVDPADPRHAEVGWPGC